MGGKCNGGNLSFSKQLKPYSKIKCVSDNEFGEDLEEDYIVTEDWKSGYCCLIAESEWKEYLENGLPL